MRELTIEESKEIQLDLLKELDCFCKCHDIKYSLAYGTLIGAIRHHGYIPWDDDIDVFLIREEYVKLIKLFKDTPSTSLISLERSRDWNRPYAKFYNKRTLCNEHVNNNIGIGVGIDVFPVDKITDDISEQKAYRRSLYFLQNVYLLKSLSFSKRRTVLKTILVCCGHFFFSLIPYRYLAIRISNLSQKYNSIDYPFLCDNVEGYHYKAPYHLESFLNYKRMRFEDMEAMVMQGYDEVLTNDYGDYMKLPPANMQVPHHKRTVFWKY